LEIQVKKALWLSSVVLVSVAAWADAATVVNPQRGYNTSVSSADFDGYLSTTGGGMYAQSAGTWGASGGGFKVAWLVQPAAGGYKYTYTMTDATDGALARSISHLIIELSANVAGNELSQITSSSTIAGTSVATHSGPGNPNIPAPLYGVKIDNGSDSVTQTFSFVINRMPVWGNFYAKDGNHGGVPVVAYNAGFTSGLTTGTMGNFIARPDSVPVIVPLPPAAFAGLVLLGVAGLKVARKHRATA
jgi:hypothetical protein